MWAAAAPVSCERWCRCLVPACSNVLGDERCVEVLLEHPGRRRGSGRVFRWKAARKPLGCSCEQYAAPPACFHRRQQRSTSRSETVHGNRLFLSGTPPPPRVFESRFDIEESTAESVWKACAQWCNCVVGREVSRPSLLAAVRSRPPRPDHQRETHRAHPGVCLFHVCVCFRHASILEAAKLFVRAC